ncbi:DUF4333 domain-containing protein [Leptolyngbya sp. PCC 6406]|uniref:DUF4333 domain-containing protein n=1 Tax=Leptolyngbya sp. PCC 6406 TaxID=1173264 RepID=UPI0002ABAB4F|nr:DUF4333 domain-containing protein [Leptolyngbya sp. PCC 6406]
MRYVFPSSIGHLRCIGLVLGLLALTACSRGLDVATLETEIQASIERQGRRLNLHQVQCPRNIPRQAGGYFRCVGQLKPEGQFTINVTQQDNEGTVEWDIPNSAVILNLGKVEAKIQSTLSQTLGKRAVVDCGDLYRINQPGEIFECRVVGGVDLGQERVEMVLIKISPEGDLTWQEVRRGIASAPVASPTAATGTGTTASNGSEAQAAAAPTSANTSTNPFPDVPKGTAGSRKIDVPEFSGEDD